MTKYSTLYCLDTKVDLEDIQDRESMRETRESGLVCQDCSTPLAEREGEPVDLYFRKVPRGVFQPAVFANAIRADLFEELRPHFSGVVPGKCYLRRRGSISLIESYVSCYTKREFAICRRGTEKVRYNRCCICQWISMAYSEGPDYFVRSEIPAGSLAFQSCVRLGFYVAEPLKETIDWARYKDALLLPVPVREEVVKVDHIDVDDSPFARFE